MLIGLALRIIIKGKKTDAWVFVNYNLIKNMDTIISFNNLFIKWFEDKNLFVLSVIFLIRNIHPDIIKPL